MRHVRLLLIVPLLAASCSSKGPEGPPPPPTSEVRGQILINGEPPPKGLTQVVLTLYPKGRDPKPGERLPQCLPGEDGTFAFSSYRENDGAEPGEYILTIEWLQLGMTGRFGPDKFLNNFNNPEVNVNDPRFQVTVVEDEPTQIPTIDINTSELESQPLHRYATPKGKK